MGGVAAIFGYLKPYNSELKLKHINEYKLEYCTLCHGIKSTYGLLSSCMLNYECTFLYIFLKSIYPDEDSKELSFYCPLSPYKKKSNIVESCALEYASFMNYHLALLKACDGCNDSQWNKKVLYRLLYWFMRKNKKYVLQREKFKNIAIKSDEICKNLYKLEELKCNDYDLCSETMGQLLYEVVAYYLENHPHIDNVSHILEFARHLGMWTYLIDAFDDFEEDEKDNRFNPLNAFGDRDDDGHYVARCLESGEMMLTMMALNLSKLLKPIHIYRHHEIIQNVIHYGTRNAVQHIKRKKEKKDGSTCKT